MKSILQYVLDVDMVGIEQRGNDCDAQAIKPLGRCCWVPRIPAGECNSVKIYKVM